MQKNTHGGAGRGQGRKADPNKKMTRRRIALRPALWDALEGRAHNEGVSFNALVEKALMQYVGNEGA